MNLGRAFGVAAVVGAALLTRPASADEPASTQQVVVTAPSSSSTSGTLTAYQYSGGVWHAVYGPVPAALGAHGLSDNRSEGDGTTPTGTFGFGATMYGVSDAAPNPRVAYHHLVCGDWWSGVYDSTYNTFQQIPCGQTMANSEALWQQTTAYQHFAVINFNVDPTVIGKGSAIFLHDTTASGVTAGCVAVAPGALDAVLGWLDPAQDPVIRIGTKAQVGPPSPLAVPPTIAARPPMRAATPAPPPAVVRPRPTTPPTTRPAPSTSSSTTTSTTASTTTPVTELAAPAPVAARPAATAPLNRAPAVVAAALLLAAVAAAFVRARPDGDREAPDVWDKQPPCW